MAPRSLLAALLFFNPISLACGSAPDAVIVEETEPGERKVISRASLQLRADAPEAVADDVAHLVQESGGYVAARSTSTVSAHVQQVDATLRVPAGQLDTVLAEIRAQGELMHEAQTADDV